MNATITNFIDEVNQLVEQQQIELVRINAWLGEKRTSMSIVAKWEGPIPQDHEVSDKMMELGLGTTYQYGKITAYDGHWKPIKSRNISVSLEEEKNVIPSLVHGILESNECLRRFMGTVTETLTARERTLENVLDKMIIAREETVASESTALALDLALQDAEKADDISIKERALSTLANLGEAYIGAQAKAIDPATLKSMLMAQPEIIDTLLDDDDVVNLIGAKYLSKTMVDNDPLEDID